MVSKSIAIAYSYTKQHRKKMKRIIPILSFTTGETKKKKKKKIKPKKKKKKKKKKKEREIREVPWPLVVTLQFDASYFHCMKTLNYNSS
jgi:hypothetical protein